MPQPQNSLLISHSKNHSMISQLRDLLDEPLKDSQWWTVLTVLQDLAKIRKNHMQTLFECNLQLVEIHWAVTPIIQAAIRCNRLADAQLASTRQKLHRQMCVRQDGAYMCAVESQIQLLKDCEELLTTAEFEKTTVFKLFEIIATHAEIPTARAR